MSIGDFTAEEAARYEEGLAKLSESTGRRLFEIYPCQEEGCKCPFLADTGIGKKICSWGCGCYFERSK